MIKTKITNEELSALPMKHFEGEIIVIDKHEDVSKAVEVLSQSPTLGFDTETRPSFKKGCKNTVSLLQLSTASTAFLFRLNHIGLPAEVANLLANKKIEKVGVAIRDDIQALQQLQRFIPSAFVELQEFVKKFQIENFGLKKLAGLVLDFSISKRQRHSNWENDSLSTAQQRYAATDAWVSYKVYKRLIKQQEGEHMLQN